MRGGRSLAEAIEEHLDEWSERTGITVEVWALPKGHVPVALSRAVMTVLREALSNTARHSHARTVAIAITMAPSGLRMTVSDDGIGFAEPVTGRGIAAMRAAFAEVGGAVRVNSVHGEGTTVSAAAPAS
ncbi:hypothetical protein GCM10023259_019340 [Thermocatellispora tengchongensis]